MARPSRSAKGSKPSPASRGFDPVRLEVFHHLFAAVAEEMGIDRLDERLDMGSMTSPPVSDSADG